MTIDVPIARNTDPYSSHLAAKDITESGARDRQKQICLEFVERHPGMTSRELADQCESDRYMFSRRLPELEREGLVHRARNPDGSFFSRKCSSGGKMSCIWWLGRENAS